MTWEVTGLILGSLVTILGFVYGIINVKNRPDPKEDTDSPLLRSLTESHKTLVGVGQAQTILLSKMESTVDRSHKKLDIIKTINEKALNDTEDIKTIVGKIHERQLEKRN